MSALAELLDLTNWSEETWSRTELTFLAESDRALFFRKSEPDRLFSLQLALSRQIFDAIAARETKRSIRPVVQAARPISRSALVPFPSAVDSPNNGRIRVRHICSVPIELPENQAAEVLALIDKLEQDDDVQKVFHTLA